MKLSALFLLLMILIAGCIQQDREKYCIQDQDCSCGTHIETGECFYGNKMYVDTSKQCPDFCTGISGTLEIKCVNKECTQVSTEKNYTVAEVTDDVCNEDDDCETPREYLIMSSCPYTSKCIENKCTVICPDFGGGWVGGDVEEEEK